MNSATRTSLNSASIQKLYEDELARNAGPVGKPNSQTGMGFIGDTVGGLVQNVFKAVRSGSRLAAAKRRRRKRGMGRTKHQNMVGKGERRRSRGKKRRRKVLKKKKCVKRVGKKSRRRRNRRKTTTTVMKNKRKTKRARKGTKKPNHVVEQHSSSVR